MNFLVFLFLILIFILLLTVAWSSVSLAPFVPTRKKDLKRILKLADLQAGELFYELGAGSGRVSVYAARNSAARAVGIEAAWPLYAVCELRRLFTGLKNLEFKFGNLFHEDLRRADVVYFFGMPDSIKKRVKSKLERELKSGTKVISYAFAVPGWQPRVVDKPGDREVSIYLYIR